MGTWGCGTFDNDGTMDWLWELEESSDLSVLKMALEPEQADYLDASDGEIIVAAAEVINAMENGPRADLPEEASGWLEKHKHLDASALVQKAITMLDRVLAEESELKELWEENEEDFPRWLENIKALRAALAKS